MAQVFVDGGLAHTVTAGYRTKGISVSEMLHDNVAAEGRLQQSDAIAQGVQFLGEQVDLRHRGIEVEEIKPRHPFLYLAVADDVQASVAYACQQITPFRLLTDVVLSVEKFGEDVVHHILAIRLIVQQRDGHSVHPAIVLPEQFHQSCFLHSILYTHENRKTKPQTAFF